jgi:hypothetical protein
MPSGASTRSASSSCRAGQAAGGAGAWAGRLARAGAGAARPGTPGGAAFRRRFSFSDSAPRRPRRPAPAPPHRHGLRGVDDALQRRGGVHLDEAGLLHGLVRGATTSGAAAVGNSGGVGHGAAWREAGDCGAQLLGAGRALPGEGARRSRAQRWGRARKAAAQQTRGTTLACATSSGRAGGARAPMAGGARARAAPGRVCRAAPRQPGPVFDPRARARPGPRAAPSPALRARTLPRRPRGAPPARGTRSRGGGTPRAPRPPARGCRRGVAHGPTPVPAMPAATCGPRGWLISAYFATVRDGCGLHAHWPPGAARGRGRGTPRGRPLAPGQRRRRRRSREAYHGSTQCNIMRAGGERRGHMDDTQAGQGAALYTAQQATVRNWLERTRIRWGANSGGGRHSR